MHLSSDLDGTLDAHVVFFGLETVVLATGHAELELVREFTGKIAVIEFLGKRVGINTATRANGFTLARRNGTHARSANARFHAAFGQGRLHVLHVFQLDERDFDALPGGQMSVAFTVLVGDFRDFGELCCSQITAHDAHAKREVVLLLLAHPTALF